MLADPEKARDVLDRWLATYQHKADRATEASLLALRGRIERDLTDASKALPWLKQAETLSPQDAATVSMLANVYREMGKEEEAQRYLLMIEDITKQYNRLDLLMRTVSQSRDDVSSRYELGLLLLRLNHLKPGLRWLMSVLEIDPMHPPTHLALGDYYDSIGDHEQAKKHRLAAAGVLKPIR
jgi:tetratricopeptide (TPR) repeat protein